MASEFKQRTCNARDLAATLNDIIDNLGEGVTIDDGPWILRLEHNDDMLICWFENDGGGE